ncbi:MAG: PAS domain S-box-containing protein [Polaribacter sp.]|jgi:PAS domain S-box-containing protein
MPSLGSVKFFVTGTIIFIIDFTLIMVFPLEELLLHFTPANIAFFTALILTLLCSPLISYAHSKHQAAPFCEAVVGQDITEWIRTQGPSGESIKKEQRADELILANKELAFQNVEKDKRADELVLANKEKEQRADELILANKELAFQNEEKDKRADELVLANKEKEQRADELILANKELAFQNEEKDKRADELSLANKEKEQRADELILANKELAFQNEEKDKRADELALANKEKEQRADELILANKELAFQNEEKDKRADELVLANKEKEQRAKELILANKENEKRADELILANKELAFQTELDGYRSETERVAQDLTLLIDTANAPIFGIDAQGKVNEWNQQAEKITGFSKKEVMGRDLVADFIKDDYKVSVWEVLAKALKGEETANFELPLFNKSGDRVDVLLNSTTRRDASGKTIGVVGVGQDITELNRVRVEQESVANELTQLIDTANAPIFGIDDQGQVNEWNQQAKKITGFTKDEVIGRDLVADFITDDFKVSVGDVLERALQGEETENYEFPLFTKTGDRVDVLLNSTTRRDAAGKIIGVVGVGQDITELKQTQSQVIQSSKLASLGEMATSVAHELNQPLNTIRMAASNIADMIEFKTVTPEYLIKKLQRIDEQVVRASKIINHMRMFGRKADENSSHLDPMEVIKSVMELVGEQLRLESIEVTTDCEHECPMILGHQIQLEQVFVNIIGNARDAILENGRKTGRRIAIKNTPIADNKLEISITDTGGGIPVKLLPHIFDPFITSKPMGKGTGLGLSVSYGIIRDMNGTIAAEIVEGGSRFKITLPIVELGN